MADAALADTADDLPIDAPANDAAPAAEPTLSDVAKAMGWSPKDEWRGDPDKWRPADEFIKTTADINRTQSRELKAMKQQVERLANTSASIVEQQVAERVAAATARFEAAVEAGDKNAAFAATREIDQLQAAKPATGNPEADFAASNPWYGKDDEATALAVGISQRYAAQGKSVAEQLEAAESAVRKFKPELFSDATRQQLKPPGVHAPTTRGAAPANRAKGAADLPASARSAGEMFVRKGLVPDMATYAKTYWAENA